MKTKSITILTLITMLCFISCKKDEIIDDKAAIVAKLQGKWEATQYTVKVYEKESNKLISEKTTPYKSNNLVIEYKDNNISYYYGGNLDEIYTYAIIGNEIRLREGNEGIYYQLKFNSDTQHTFTEEDYYTINKVLVRSAKETFYNRK